MSEVRGRSREDPMPEGRRPRGVTPRPRSGAVAESTRLRRRRNRREELPCVRGQAGRPRGDTQRPTSGAQREELSRLQGQGWRREELPRLRGQGRRPEGPTPHPRSRGCAGAGGPRGAIPR